MAAPTGDSRVVYVKSTLAVQGPDGMPIVLRRGEAWDADAQIVQSRPELFTDDRVTIHSDHGVERATRAPGERRNR